MTSAYVFVASVAAGGALLALWVELRYPSLAPQRLVSRLVAVAVGCVVVQLGALAFERTLALPVGPKAAALIALAMLLPAVTFAFVTAMWLLRSLQAGATR